jgi:hypothetical protein
VSILAYTYIYLLAFFTFSGAYLLTEILFVIDMARDIFELVAEGPDADDIWQAYQDDPEDEKLLDEEEMEAQMVDAD